MGKGAVYPRWRGEHLDLLIGKNILVGLSPLARGTQLDGTKSMFNSRFIPAGAGNTLATFSTGAGFAVYPRWRGEHGCAADNKKLLYGLSPLARGTQYSDVLKY